MIHKTILQEKIRQLQRKREKVNAIFLDALSYPSPFNEAKKIFFELKAIDEELNTLKLSLQLNQ